MSRTPKTPAAASEPELAVAGIPLASVPAVAALLALLDAMRALVSFPSRPVPDSLVEGVVAARQTFKEALAVEFAPAAFPGSAYDDAWISERFDKFAGLVDERFTGLDEALKARFEAVDQAIKTLATFEAEARALLAGRLQEVEARIAGGAEDIGDRLAALEAAAAAQAKG